MFEFVSLSTIGDYVQSVILLAPVIAIGLVCLFTIASKGEWL